MRLPRDVSADELVRALQKIGYTVIRQTGSHIRLATEEHGEHHVTIPQHDPLRLGTLSGVITDVAEHFGLNKEQILARLFGR